MQFKPDLAKLIIEGKKTQTRRIVKPGQEWEKYYATGAPVRDAVITNGREVYRVGNTYAVCPGRGKRALHYNPRTLETDESWLQECKDNGMDISLWGDSASAVGGFVQARIRILEIWNEDVRNISSSDSKAEGFEDEFGFMQTWCSMHDPKVHISREKPGRFQDYTKRTVVDLRNQLKYRPKELYDAWAIRFELCR